MDEPEAVGAPRAWWAQMVPYAPKLKANQNDFKRHEKWGKRIQEVMKEKGAAGAQEAAAEEGEADEGADEDEEEAAEEEAIEEEATEEETAAKGTEEAPEEEEEKEKEKEK